MADKKTDNASLPSKIAIRRWLLSRMGFEEVWVLDTCTGLGKIWSAMEEHVTIRQWTRCDVKPRRAGTLAMSAAEAVQAFPLAVYNVIDIDPYGEPWEAFHLALGRLTRPTAIFLTHGHVMQAQVASASLRLAGLPTTWDIPRTPVLSAFIAEQLVSLAWNSVDIIHSAKISFPRVTYYALGVQPKA